MKSVMRILFLSVVLSFASNVSARPDSLWSMTIDWGVSTTISGATQLRDGSIALIGSIDSSTAQSSTLVARISREGELLWNRGFIPSSVTRSKGTSAVELSSGSLALTGWSYSPSIIVSNISSSGSLAQSWNYEWPSGQTKSYAIALRSDNNLAVTGYRYNVNQQRSDAVLMLKRQTGDTLWTRTFGGDSTDIGVSLIAGENSSVVIGGSTRSVGAGNFDLFLTKFDINGNELWSRTYGDADNNLCYGIARGPDNGYYLAGRTLLISGESDPVIIRTDSVGTQQWIRSDYSVGSAQCRGIAAYRTDGAIAAGFLTEPAGHWLIGVDSSGNADWQWSWGQAGDTLHGIIEVGCGSYLAFGSTVVNGHSAGYAIFLGPERGLTGIVHDEESGLPDSNAVVRAIGAECQARTSSQGRYTIELEQSTYDVELSGPCIETDTTFGIEISSDSIFTQNLVSRRPRLIDVHTSLNILAHNRLEAIGELEIHNDGAGAMNYAVSVLTQSPQGTWLTLIPPTGVVPANSSTMIQVRAVADTTDDRIYEFTATLGLRTNSCPDSFITIPVFVTVLDVDDQPLLPRELSLSPIYPNPFNAEATVEFELPRAGQVELTAFDVLGRVAFKITNGIMTSGSHRVSWKGRDLPSGLYLIELRQGAEHRFQKALLLK